MFEYYCLATILPPRAIDGISTYNVVPFEAGASILHTVFNYSIQIIIIKLFLYYFE